MWIPRPRSSRLHRSPRFVALPHPSARQLPGVWDTRPLSPSMPHPHQRHRRLGRYPSVHPARSPPQRPQPDSMPYVWRLEMRTILPMRMSVPTAALSRIHIRPFRSHPLVAPRASFSLRVRSRSKTKKDITKAAIPCELFFNSWNAVCLFFFLRLPPPSSSALDLPLPPAVSLRPSPPLSFRCLSLLLLNSPFSCLLCRTSLHMLDPPLPLLNDLTTKESSRPSGFIQRRTRGGKDQVRRCSP